MLETLKVSPSQLGGEARPRAVLCMMGRENRDGHDRAVFGGLVSRGESMEAKLSTNLAENKLKCDPEFVMAYLNNGFCWDIVDNFERTTRNESGAFVEEVSLSYLKFWYKAR